MISPHTNLYTEAVTTISRFTLLLTLSILCCIFYSVKAKGHVYFSDDFESGNLDKWHKVRFDENKFPEVPTPWDIVSNIGVNTSKMLHLHYFIPDGQTPAHFDVDYSVQKDLSGRNLGHFFVRGCFYLKRPIRQYLGTRGKKLFYIFSEDHHTRPSWDLIVSAFGGRNIKLPTPDGGEVTKFFPLQINVGSNGRPYADLSHHPENGLLKGVVSFDSWHCMEVEVKLNTPGNPPAKDGRVRFWFDGDLVFDRQNLSIRKSNKPLGNVRVGAQIDRNGDTNKRESDRYWDNIVVSSTRNGTANVIGHLDNLVPPSGLKIYGMDNE